MDNYSEILEESDETSKISKTTIPNLSHKV